MTRENFEQICLEVFPNCVFKPSLCWGDLTSEFAYNGEYGPIVADMCVDGKCRVYTEYHAALDYTLNASEFQKQLKNAYKL